MFAYQGTQANTIMFDELTHFLERQFWYMFTRNRSPAGLPCLIRATCNPDADSWVKDLIKWYLKPDGLPDYTRAGKIRYFLRINEQMYWASTREELMVAHNCEATDIKSFTFIPANLQDNQILMQNDPRYIANLKAQNVVERDRLLYGNWNIKTEGKVFKQQDFIPYLIAPKFDYTFMFIDTASKTKEHNDYSVLQLWGKGEKGIYLVDQLRGKWQAPELEIMTVSFVSKHSSVLKLFIEDASAGSALIQKLQRTINKPIIGIFRDKDKYSRAWECQAYVTSGYVHLNPMNDYYIPFIGEVTGFTADDKHAHDDQVDCMMDAIDKMLIRPDMPLKPAEYVSMSSRVV